MAKRSPQPEPEEEIDYDAEFAKLDAKVAQPVEQQSPPEGITEVRVQFRGEMFGDNPAVQLVIGDQVVAYIDAKDMDLLGSSIPRLGAGGNTVVVWGYVPPEN